MIRRAFFIAVSASAFTFAHAQQLTPVVELGRLEALSQGNAGTCWSFATISFLESELERIHGSRIDLSELHTVYFTYLEKCRRFVRLHGKTQFSQGGLCHDVIDIVAKYGAVPSDAYTGLRGDRNVHNHDELEKVLKATIDEIAASKRPSDHWEDAVRGILSAYLGEVPETVDVDGKTRTPLQYAHEDLRIPVGDYRQLMSLESEPYWQRRQLLVPDNWAHCNDYWNVPLDVMLENLDHALHAGYTVAVDVDVSEPGALGGRGNYIWKLSKPLEEEGAITPEIRQRMFDVRATTDDHLMHIVGISKDETGKLYYLTKNSHGRGGPYDGHVFMSRNYVAAKMLSFMAHKDALRPETIERTDG